jgi:hypothetical protein
MRNYSVGFVTAIMVVLSFVAGFQPAYANVAVQIQKVSFSHIVLYDYGDPGTYIQSGDSVTIAVTLQNNGNQPTTLVVCPEQMVSYVGGGNGDQYTSLCNTITLGIYSWSDWPSSGTVTMQRTATATFPGSLEYRIHVFDAAGPEIATSEWYDVVNILP